MKYKYDIYNALILTFVVIFGAIRNISLPGLYADAINPDYFVNYFFHNTFNNIAWIYPYIGIPIFGQPYHGNIPFFIGTPIYLIFGSTIEAQRMLNAFYGVVLVILNYLLLVRIIDRRKIAFGVTLGLATNIALISAFRTQMYIIIPGACLILAAIYLLVVKDGQLCKKKIFLSGVLSGIAFYSYFVYLFYVPAFLAFIYLNFKKNIRVCLNWLLGFCIPASLYLIGYLGIFFKTFFSGNFKGTPGILFSIVIISFLLAISLPVYKICKDEDWLPKEKFIYKRYIFSFIGSTLIGIGYLFYSGYITKIISAVANWNNAAIHMGSKPIPLFEKVIMNIKLFFGAISNSGNEIRIFKEITSRWNSLWLIIIILSIIIAFYIIIRKKIFFQKEVKFMMFFLGSIVVFFICCVPLATNLQANHYFSIIPLSFMILGICGNIIYNYLSSKYSKICVIKRIGYLLICFLVVFNFINQGFFQYQLKYTGGRGYYSEQINILSSQAVVDRKNGKNELYIFPEWGFMMGFSFLTENSVPYIIDINVDKMKELKANDRNVVLCFWNPQNQEKYMEIINQAGMNVNDIKFWRERDGNIAFYSIEAN